METLQRLFNRNRLSFSTSRTHLRFCAWLFIIIVTVSCSNSSDSEPTVDPVSPPAESCSLSEIESDLTGMLQQAQSDSDFSYVVERLNDNRRYVYNRGGSTLLTSYESASTSKWVTAVAILRLIDDGYLSLDDHPQTFISAWPISMTDTLYSMTLQHLLSFTSGLEDEPLCLNLPGFDFENCVINIGNLNVGNTVTPGQRFYYSGTHMQVAGLMAIKARNVGSWQDIFEEFKSDTGTFPTANYDLPSLTNPRLGGGMHWTGEEYMAFLSSLANGELLSSAMMTEMLRDQTADAVVAYSPVLSGLNEEWHYGLGLWHECASTFFNCVEGVRVSSAGAYGAYPFWDRNQDYIGLVAKQGTLGIGSDSVVLTRSVQTKTEEWVNCQ